MTLDELRRYAVARQFGPPADLAAAIARMGYVQADPIRAPARAQDLILRHRVKDYRADDLERAYPGLPVFEDMLHNYGYFPEAVRALLYPRALSPRWREYMDTHRALRRRVLAWLDSGAEAHPREVGKALGQGARVNGWGGSSSATTLMLEALHREGRARVARRDNGLRVYAKAIAHGATLTRTARADGIIRLMANLYAPLPERTLMHLFYLMGPYKPDQDYAARVALMVRRGELAREKVEGLTYLWPAAEATQVDIDDTARLLAPFDPLVWDRLRFKHLWGWDYRFEAYTPAAKRKLGYYALPLLWRDRVIGWANALPQKKQGRLEIEAGLAIDGAPEGGRRRFNTSLRDEQVRAGCFLSSSRRSR